jgi:hypothetical protein
MKLPSNLAKRYTRMTDQEMSGDAAAGLLMKAAGMQKGGGRPGPIQIPDAKITKAILRPGVIQWDDKTDAGVSFNMRKDGGGQGIPSVSNLNLSKILQSRYVQQDIKQGRNVREFAPVAPPAAPAAPPAEEAVATVKAAAKVEAKATALAAKAKATKEKALEGLGYYFGEEDAVATAQKEFADANAAMHAPTCNQGSATGLPAVVCDPSLGAKVAEAAKKLEDAKGGSNKTLILGAVAAAAIGGFLWWKYKA